MFTITKSYIKTVIQILFSYNCTFRTLSNISLRKFLNITVTLSLVVFQSVTLCATLNAHRVFRPPVDCLLSTPLTFQRLCVEKRQTLLPFRSKRLVGMYVWRDGWSSRGNLRPQLHLPFFFFVRFFSQIFVHLCLLIQKWQTWSAGVGEEICGARWNQSVHLWKWAQRRSVLYCQGSSLSF